MLRGHSTAEKAHWHTALTWDPTPIYSASLRHLGCLHTLGSLQPLGGRLGALLGQPPARPRLGGVLGGRAGGQLPPGSAADTAQHAGQRPESKRCFGGRKYIYTKVRVEELGYDMLTINQICIYLD